MHRFYAENFQNAKAQLTLDEAHHALKVMRLNIGDKVEVFDGKGNTAIAIISATSKREVELDLTEIKEGWDKKLNLPAIAIAPTKNINRYEWFVEKATEIGVSCIYPILCSHSERKNLRIDRLQKLILSATKQSQRTVLPRIEELQSFSKFIENNKYEQNLIGYCDDNILNSKVENNLKTCFLIGPEGDFSIDEFKLAVKKEFKPITFGHARLRTETAGIFACSTFQNAFK